MNAKLSLIVLSSVLFVGLLQAKRPKLTGKSAPFFTAMAAFAQKDGSVSIREFNLKDFIGTSDIVLYFYPFDSTPKCTKQAESFRDHYAQLKKAGITVIGVSCDSPQSHKRFIQKLRLPYPLVSDTRIKREISSKYGTVGFFHSKRRTFLINKKGIVVKVFDDVSVDTQIDDILQGFAQG